MKRGLVNIAAGLAGQKYLKGPPSESRQQIQNRWLTLPNKFLGTCWLFNKGVTNITI